MKKLVLATCTALLLSLGLFFSNSPLLTTTAEAKSLEYSIYLKPGGTYQLGYGPGYQYLILQGTYNNLTVSSSGLVTLSKTPFTVEENDYLGDIYVYDRYGRELEYVQAYLIW
ncbi:hypothetical protein [Paenibacillus sp. CGMCC 1.18879]|uniref:hypothetical protein n=1 Tax=Paenibacillus sp. CGMCC 1.18879 TaxID=2834466 RepID=UPI001CA8F4B3|nr:hypothetical protein [Paenibacillus sp. CGMCC 1.18879]MBY9081012.1 hypothetical protein [Paenibacillus sp. CGMCC 1.18879]